LIIVAVGGGIGIYYVSPDEEDKDDCESDCKRHLKYVLPIAIGAYVVIELFGLIIDIFNLVMVKSDNSIEITKGPCASCLNWFFMVANLIIIIYTGVISFADGINSYSFGYAGYAILTFLAFNLPGLVLFFTQVAALLYISKAKKVNHTVAMTFPPSTTIQIPPKPTQAIADPRVAGGSAQIDPA
jgi:hypothetical protein